MNLPRFQNVESRERLDVQRGRGLYSMPEREDGDFYYYCLFL